MRNTKVKAGFAAAMAMLLAVAAGCEMSSSSRVEPATQPAARAPRSEYMAKSAVKKESTAGGETAVDGALAWAERYSQATKKIESLQVENRDLVQKNQLAQQQAMRQQAEIDQAQKELKEANAMLLEMRQELDKWKADVLGFRQEIRASQKAQMESLQRILKLLGAEPIATQPTPAPAGGANPKDVAP